MPSHATETAGSIAADTDTNIKAVTIRIGGGAEITTTIGEISREQIDRVQRVGSGQPGGG